MGMYRWAILWAERAEAISKKFARLRGKGSRQADFPRRDTSYGSVQL
jgi:hypothetical protein